MAIWLAAIDKADASNNFYNDTSGDDIFTNVFQAGGCSGCHVASNAACVNTMGGDAATAFLGYSGVVACYSRIIDKLDGVGNGDQMPLFGPYTDNPTYKSLLGTWNSLGRPSAPPTVTTGSATSISKTGATLDGTFNYNVYSGTSVQGTYRFRYNTSQSTIGSSLTPAVNDTGTGIETDSATISGLSCGTTYYFRGQVTNGGGSANGSWVSFNTDPCTDPVITEGASTTVDMDEDGSPTAFSLTLNATDDDPGTLQWTISNAASPGTAGTGGDGLGNSEPITYSPPLNYTGSDSFEVTVENLTTGLTDTIAVTVNISPINDPPDITEIDPVAVLMDEDSTPTAFSLILNATDSDNTGPELTWSIPVGGTASNGTASASGSGSSKVIGYTPDPDFNGADSFTVRVASGTPFDEITVNVTITPQPDNPVAVDDGPITFDIGVPVDIPVVANDTDVDGDSLTVAFGSILGVSSGATAVPVTGDTEIRYTSTTEFTANTFRYRAVDDSTDSLTSNNQATVSLSPRDTDGDGVINYLDNCPLTSNAGQEDNDNDSGAFINNNNLANPAQDIITPLREVNTAPGSSPGGDACDVDDDNDGMHDDYENDNSLDPLDPSDAAADNDGDGISNYDELVNGTNPNLADLVIDATGYFTPFELAPPEPKSVHQFATAVTPIFESMLTDTDPNNPTGPYRPGINDIRWVPSNSMEARLDLNDSGNLLQTPPVQTLRIRPIVSFAANQQVAEGGTASVQVTLNGVSPSWPGTDVTVNYSVSGSADDPADYTIAPAGGTVTFADQDFSETITVTTNTDAVADSGETIVFTITGVSNAAIGTQSSHRVTIVEGNVAPEGSVTFSQGAGNVGTAYADVNGGVVVIDLNPFDANGDTLSYDWSGTDSALIPVLPVTDTSTSSSLSAGNYLVDVTITDDGSPIRSTRLTRVLNVEANAPSLTGADTDGDGTADSAEGYDDGDGDGIPDYLDAQDGTAGAGNLIPDQTVNMASSHLLESNPGTILTRGQSAASAGRFGALVTDDDIEQFGGTGGIAPLNGDDSLEHATGVYDFEVHGLMPGASANIVIPLQTAIPKNAVYRKFNSVTGWSNFVVNSFNRVASAPGAQGACPEPGSSLYESGLNYLDLCIQLTIQDGGPNDTDNAANGVVADPGTTGISLSDPEIEAVEDGGGRMSPIMLAVLMMLCMLAIGRRQKRFACPPER